MMLRQLVSIAVVSLSLVTSAAFAATATNIKSSDVEVVDGWIPVPPPGAKTGALYFVLKNKSGTELALKSVRVAGAGSAEIHETTKGPGDAMGMKRLAELDIPAGGSTTLAPGGLHVMIFDMPLDLKPGKPVEVVLTLTNGTEIKATATARVP